MVAYIRSDLDFILAQIKIAEAHAAGQPLYGPGGLIPTYNLAWGLRTVDGSNNNLLHPTWGSSDQPFPEGLGTEFRTVMVPAGPGGALVPVSYTPGTDNDGSASEPVRQTVACEYPGPSAGDGDEWARHIPANAGETGRSSRPRAGAGQGQRLQPQLP